MEKKRGWLARLSDWFRETVLWTHVIAIVLEWLGWQSLVISFVFSIAGAVGGVMQGIPLSISLMAAFCVFVAAIYLFQIPSFVRATREVRSQERPDPDVWRHVERMTLAQTACLLANITPQGAAAVPRGDAAGWYEALKGAVASDEMKRIPTTFDGQNTFSDGYHPHNETLVSREEIIKFVKKRNLIRAVFSN